MLQRDNGTPEVAGSSQAGALTFLAEFASKIKALGPSGYLRSTSHQAGEPVTLDDEEA